MNYKDELYEDLLLDLDYLAWKREKELQAWCEYVNQKEAEEEAYNIMAEQYFTELEELNLINTI